SGHSGKRNLRKTKAKPLVRKEEKRTIFQNLTSERSSKIVLPLFWLRLFREVGEPIVSIKQIISQIVECRTVKLIRSRARNDGNLPSGCTAKFGRIRRSLYAEFLQGIHRN